MRIPLAIACLVLAEVIGVDLALSASPVLPPILRKVGFDQRLDAQVPLDLEFRDESGRPIRLRDVCGQKPVLLVLAYYECPMLCTRVLNGLVQGLREVPFKMGQDYRVVTVSFNPADTPALAAAKKQTYLRLLGKTADPDGWSFLTGGEPAIRELTDAVGFRYQYDPATGQFAHAAGVVVLTPDGRVSRYFYDLKYSGRDLRLGLVEASEHRIGSPVDQVLLFCLHYDPSAGRYGAAIMNIVRILGVCTVFGMVWGFRFLRRGEHNRRSTTATRYALPTLH